MSTVYDGVIAADARTPLWLVEITTDRYCSLEQAVAPCGMAISLDGPGDPGDGARCSHSYGTCPLVARPTFSPTTKTWRLTSKDVPVPPTLLAAHAELWPIVKEVSAIKQAISFGTSSNAAEHVTLTLQDTGGDPLTPDAEPVDPDKTVRNTGQDGTTLTRWLSAWPHFAHMRVLVRRGFLTSSYADIDFEDRWIGRIERVETDGKGIWTIGCVDLTAGLSRELPPKSAYTQMIGTLSRTATTIPVHDASVFTDPDAWPVSVTTDTFTRSDQVHLASPYTKRETHDLDLVSGVVTQDGLPNNPGTIRLYTHDTAQISEDGTGYAQASVRLSTTTAGNELGVVAGWDTSHYYGATISADGFVTLYRKGAAYADTASVTVVAGTWYTLRLEIHKDHVSVLVDGEEVLRRDDLRPQSGKGRGVGLFGPFDDPGACVLSWDDFEAGPLPLITGVGAGTFGDIFVQWDTFNGRQEIARLTARDLVSDPNTITVVRAQHETYAEPALDGTVIREVLSYRDAHPLLICQDLALKAGMLRQDFDAESWTAAKYLIGPMALSRTIAEPAAANSLMMEVLDLCMAIVYVQQDTSVGIFVNHPLLAFSETATTVDDETVVLENSGKIQSGEPERLTHVAVVSGLPAGSDEVTQGVVTVAYNAETYVANFFGDAISDLREKKITSHWIEDDDVVTPGVIVVRRSLCLAKPPRKYEWDADLALDTLRIGDPVVTDVDDVLDDFGERLPMAARVIEKTPLELRGFHFLAQHLGYGAPNETDQRYGVMGPSTLGDYDSASDDERDTYAWISDSSTGGSLVTDAFTRSNQVHLASPWTKRGSHDLDLISNAVTQSGLPANPGTGDGRLYTHGTDGLAANGTGYVQAKVKFSTTATLQAAGVVLGWSSGNYYHATLAADGGVVFGTKTLSYTPVAFTVAANTYYTIRLIQGVDYVSIKIDGTQVYRRAATVPLGSLKVGVIATIDDPASCVITWDDFEAGTLDTEVNVGADEDPPYLMY